jgi:uncharacterized hydrophobic protein (TIGR00271 family)
MLHLRVISPSSLTERTLGLLRDDDAVTHLFVLTGAAQRPVGDVISCDIAREGAEDILEQLRELGLEEQGGISVEQVDLTLSTSADVAVEKTPGDPADAIIWSDIEQRSGDEGRVSWTYLVFMSVAMIIASIGVLLDQPILIVGSMVVGPEFGPLAALCTGIVALRRSLISRALVTLVGGFLVGMVITVGATLLLTTLGLIDRGMLLAPRPLTSFIWQPDALSWVIGLLAGIAGMLSLTAQKSGALVGVLISVTTIPAAANAAVALAYGVPEEAGGSALQLLINLSAIIVAGVITLVVQRFAQQRLAERRRRRSEAAA